ncbi:MAG: hypothetical protein JJU35_10580 [Balneolales bacterium]|nr:hypothetical protein [Balneolales bacterium]
MKSAIEGFASLNLEAAALNLFQQLRVPLNILKISGQLKDFLNDSLKTSGDHIQVGTVTLLGSVDEQIFKGEDSSLDYKSVMTNKADYDGLLIFTVEMSGEELPRTLISDVSRLLNRSFNTTPVVVLFRYEDKIALANVERTEFKQQWRQGEKVGRVSILKDVKTKEPHEGHVRIISSLSLPELARYERRNRIESFKELYSGWLRVFSTNVLNEQFYRDYQQLSVKLIRAIYPSQIESKLHAHQGVLNLLNRMMFIYFIQKKGWLMQDPDFLHNYWRDYNKEAARKDSFHKYWLNKLFFKAFNNQAFNDPEIFKVLPEKYQTPMIEFPYLNGGLFELKTEFDSFVLQDAAFEDIFDFLESYIFTIKEDTPEELNLEINPELLGKMYEGMINATDLDDVDAENGIVYTERPEINFMVRRSIVEVIAKKIKQPAYTALKDLSREFIYHFVFDTPQTRKELLSRYRPHAESLIALILSVRALDPACGSGSMLLGLIQVQMELITALYEYDKHTLGPKESFYLKKQLVSESIYGVDIKEWAVKIAELRLWLYMIADAEFTKEELNKEPLLPNLDFKIQTGNSLLPKLGSMDFDIKKLLKKGDRRSGAARKLNEFIRDKKKFIRNELPGESYTSMKNREISAISGFISELIREKSAQLAKLPGVDKNIFGNKNEDRYSEDRKQLSDEIEALTKEQAKIKEKKSLPFSFDINFMEVFLLPDDPGFDLVIGNPPYVRQEDILPPEDGEYLEHLLKPENKSEKTKVNKKFKVELNRRVYDLYPFLNTKVNTDINGKRKSIPVYGAKVPGRSDLYVYFQLICPAYLNSEGTFCFIISNSWMDVDFGGFVQHFMLKHTKLHAIYDCTVRSFSAAVNTVIYLHSSLINTRLKIKDYKLLTPTGNPVRFVMNKADYTETSYAPLLIEQEHCSENTFKTHYRIILKTPTELCDEAYDEEAKSFQSDKWGGKYLRAPEIYYTILEKGKQKLIHLKNIANVKRGITTGANDFFIIDDSKVFDWNIEHIYLLPIVKSSRQVKVLKNPKKISNWLLSINDKQIISKNLKAYLLYGADENKWDGNAPALRSTVQARNKWYMIGERKVPDIACNYMIDTIMRFFDYEALVVDNFQEIHLNNKLNKNLALLSLNSTLFSLFLNVIGRGNFGDGLMKLQTFEVRNLIMPDPIYLKNFKNDTFLKREHNNLFEELGFNQDQTIRAQLPNPLPDRKLLDDAIFDELDLTQEERNEVYWSVAEMVKTRLDKAGSR